MIIKEGFIYSGFRFGFKNKKLYRLATIKNNRNYPTREVPVISLSKTAQGYRLIRTKKSLAQVRDMVEKVNWTIKERCKECL